MEKRISGWPEEMRQKDLSRSLRMKGPQHNTTQEVVVGGAAGILKEMTNLSINKETRKWPKQATLLLRVTLTFDANAVQYKTMELMGCYYAITTHMQILSC